MKRIKNFKRFVNESLFFTKSYNQQINENLQAAKQYMLNKFSKKKSGGLTKEEEMEILSNPDYLEIKNNIAADNTGLVNAFVRFHFEQGATLDRLKTLKDNLTRYKDSLGSLPMNIDQYAKIVVVPRQERLRKLNSDLKRAIESGDEKWISDMEAQIEMVKNEVDTDTRPGIERLEDELRYIEKEREARWLIEGLPANAYARHGRPVNLKEEYRSADKETKDRIINIANIINKDNDSETLKKRFLKKIAGFNSIQRLAQFGEDFIASIGSDIDSLKVKAESLYPGVAIMYEDSQYLALSLRSEDAQKALCSGANWCINRGAFWNYAKGNIQLNIFNYGVPQSNPMHIIGITITPEGKVSTSHDINDRRIGNGERYDEFLLEKGYPQELVDEIRTFFATEVSIKKLTDTIYTKGNVKDSVKGFLFQSYKFVNDSEFQSIKSILYDILDQSLRIGSVNRDSFKDIFYAHTPNESVEYSGLGLINPVCLELFKTIFPDPDPEFMRNVAMQTMRVYQNVENVKNDPAQIRSLTAKRPEVADYIENILKNKERMMKIISQYLP